MINQLEFNNIMANTIRYIHFTLIIYILIGHQLTPIKYLKYYLLLVIFIFLDWNDFDGQCILTKLEYYFKTDSWNQKPAIQEGAPEFFRPFINNIFNLNLTREEAERLNNFVFMGCFLLGFYRLLNYYNI